MAKTILVPTDFTIRSLHTLKHALDRHDQQPLDVVFFSGALISHNIIDLLFATKDGMVTGLTSNEFKEACEIVRNKYNTQINALRFDLFTGFTQAAFNNFTDGNRIDEIYIPENKLHYGQRLFDPISYMQKSPLPKVVVSWPEREDIQTANHLSELFTSWT